MGAIFALVVSLAAFQTLADEEKTRIVSGSVEHVELVEGEGMVKISGEKNLLVIRDLLEFPEKKIRVLQDNQGKKKKLRLKVAEPNRIVDVLE